MKKVLLMLMFLGTIAGYSQPIQKLISGSTVATPELHNVTCSENCQCIGDGKYCFRPTDLVVNTPNSKWVFIDEPYLEVVEDNQGSAAWNMLDRLKNNPKDRFMVTLNNPTEKRARVLSGSRSFKVRLVCLAQYHP